MCVKTQIGQLLASIPLRALSGLRHLTWMAAANNLAASWFDLSFLPTLSWWWVAAGWLLFITPVGRIIITATGVRLVLAGVQPGEYPRGGKIHLRVWLAERLADEMGAMSLSSAPFTRLYALASGRATVGKDVDLHSIPPVTGMLALGDGCSVEPEVDLSGHWIDGNSFHVGRVTIGKRARIGARTTLVVG